MLYTLPRIKFSFIDDLAGVRRRGIQNPFYRFFYRFLSPLMSLIRPLWPGAILTTEVMGLAMLNVARRGFPETLLNSKQINDLAREEVPLS